MPAVIAREHLGFADVGSRVLEGRKGPREYDVCRLGAPLSKQFDVGNGFQDPELV